MRGDLSFRGVMNLDDNSPIERSAVEEAASAWAHRDRNTMAKRLEHTESEFRLVTRCWLRFGERLQEPGRPPSLC